MKSKQKKPNLRPFLLLGGVAAISLAAFITWGNLSDKRVQQLSIPAQKPVTKLQASSKKERPVEEKHIHTVTTRVEVFQPKTDK